MIALFDNASVKFHWKDAPYKWQSKLLQTGDIFYAQKGTEHIARSIGEAHIPSIKKKKPFN